MGVAVVKNAEQLGEALILLQEILLGYDNAWYKERCATALRESTDCVAIPTFDIIRWKSGGIASQTMIQKVEELLAGVER